jgi:hypothetical protein
MDWSRFIHGINYYDPKKGLPPSPPSPPTTGECATCGHIVSIYKLQAVKITETGMYSGSCIPYIRYYCNSCTQPYDEKEIMPFAPRIRYFKRMEVDEFGKPLESK